MMKEDEEKALKGEEPRVDVELMEESK